MWKFFWWLLMVGGLLWGCSLFFFGFFLRFLRVFLARLYRFPWSFIGFWLGFFGFLLWPTWHSWPRLFLILGRDYFDLIGLSCSSLLILVVLVILSWLFGMRQWCSASMAMVVPIFRGYCSFADADSGRPHWAYDGDSFFASSRIVPSS